MVLRIFSEVYIPLVQGLFFDLKLSFTHYHNVKFVPEQWTSVIRQISKEIGIIQQSLTGITDPITNSDFSFKKAVYSDYGTRCGACWFLQDSISPLLGPGATRQIYIFWNTAEILFLGIFQAFGVHLRHFSENRFFGFS